MEKNMSVTIAGDVLCDIVSGFLQGIGVHCYIDGIDAAPGGATGLSIIDLAVTPYLPVYTGNRFMACIIGGVLVGIGMAVVFMSGSTTQMYKAKKLIYQIDPKAFLIVSEAREVYGEGFLASDQE